MTYTFKLSRRLAVSRARATLAIGVVLTACSNDATGPDAPASGAPYTPTSFRVVPATVTIETNQPIRFRGATSAGHTFRSALLWHASGGSIDADGNFTASAPGTYKVVGRARGRQRPDTSVVVVVPPQPDLAAIYVAPDPVALEPGTSYAFSASGRLADGSTAPVGVTWSATGGSIDAAGVYKAGATAGTYRVVATHTGGSLADTAGVTIEAEEAPPPPPASPTLAEVVVKPVSVSLTTGAVRQFLAFGRDSNGDSLAVVASYSASGGSITRAGLYTAGSTAGTFRVVAVVEGLADTAVVTLTAPEVEPPPAPVEGSVPYGAFAAWRGTELKQNSDYFTLGMGADNASGIVARIDAARRMGKKVLLVMTGGDHGNYLSVIDGQLQFDRNKWNAKMQTFNTAEIRRAVAAGVADGVVVGNSVMDEPHVSGGGDGNTWGPVGTLTKARVDELCGYVKQIFPTLPVGVVHRHDIFEPSNTYRTCDFLISQYSNRLGSVSTFRDGGLAFARRSGIAIAFSMNILNGGVQDTDGTWDCTGTGGKGTYSPNCRMTPTQVRDYGQALGQSGCAMFMWRYDDLFMANSNNQSAFKAVADLLARQPRTLCTRA
jgi:hypothetical protein